MASTAATLLVEIGADLRDFNRSMASMNKTVAKTSRKMQRIGKVMSAAVTLPLVGAGAAAIKTAGDFEESMTKIETLVGQSAEQVDKWGQSITQLAPEVGRTPHELADALFVVTSAGQRGAQAMDIVEQSAKAAALGLGETREIARSVTSAMNAYGAENLSASRATNVLLSTIREGNVEASSLAPVLGRVIGIASQMGVSFEEVGANIATFTRLGVGADEAVTGLRSVMTQLLKPTEDARQALAGVGLSAEGLRQTIRKDGLQTGLNALVTAFGDNQEALTRVIPNVRALSNVMGTAGSQAETYGSILQSVSQDTASVDKEFAKISDNLNQQLRRLKGSLTALANAIGETGLLRQMTQLVRGMADIATRLGETNPKILRTAVVIAGITAAVGPAIAALGFLGSAITTVAGAVGGTLTGLGALATVAVGLAVAMGELPPGLEPVEALLKTLMSSAKGSVKEMSNLGEVAKKVAGDPVGALKTEMNKFLAAQQATNQETTKTTQGIDGMAQSAARAKQQMSGLSAFMDSDFGQQMSGMFGPIMTERMAGGRVKANIKKTRDQIRAVSAEALRIPEKTIPPVKAAAGEINMFAARFGNLGKAIATGFIGSIGRAIGQALVELRSFQDALTSVGRIAKSALANFLGTGIQAGLTSLLPGAGGFLSIFKNLIGVPGLASGGIVTGPTLAMIGEGGESEAVIPLSKLDKVMGGNQKLTARISGEDLVFIIDRVREGQRV